MKENSLKIIRNKIGSTKSIKEISQNIKKDTNGVSHGCLKGGAS
jgi:hypothetical protein